MLFDLFGIHWVQSTTVKETLLRWHGSFMDRRRKKIWSVAPLCLFWMVWKEKNIKAFENEDHSI